MVAAQVQVRVVADQTKFTYTYPKQQQPIPVVAFLGEIMLATTESIWQTHHDQLLRFIKTKVSNDQLADDILQDVFVKIHQSLTSLKDIKALNGWIYQITRNTITDFYKKNKLFDPLEDIAENKDDDVELREMVSAWINSCVHGLDAHYREAIELSDLKGMSQKEIATKLGITYSGLKSRVQRGREKVKDIILECCHLDFDFYGNPYDYECKNSKCVH